MPKTIDAARCARFLRVLAETGNQSIAAERVKVSRSWIRLARKADPAFDRAVQVARVAGARPGDPAFGKGGYFEGKELVRRGVRGRRVQVARARPREWSPAAENRFLAVLAGTCSVLAACTTVGLSPSSAYQHRRRRPDFAARWAEALEQGALDLETALLEAAIHAMGEPRDPDVIPELTFDRPISADEAIAFLRKHKNAQARRERAETRTALAELRVTWAQEDAKYRRIRMRGPED